MKTLLFFVLLFNAFLAFAQTKIEHIDKKYQGLNRVQKVIVDGREFELGFVFALDGAYFYTPYEQHQMRIWQDYNRYGYQVTMLLDNETLISFELYSPDESGVFEATKTPVKVTSWHRPDSGPEIWAESTPTGEAVKIKVELKNSLIGPRSIGEVITRTGTMDFSACDGCEHGDQFMIDGINVVEVGFGKYYIPDCEGEVHRLLSQLLEYNHHSDEEGLKVPFTYKGLINLNSSDLIEDVVSMWEADERAGTVYIGYSAKVPVERFIDSLIYKTAQKLRVEAHEIWDDVLEKAQFTSFKDDVLTFRYGNLTIKTDIKTLKTLEY